MKEKRRKRGMILEARKSDREADMLADALKGKDQILDKEYLRGFDGYDTVMCYGISFYRKKALVKRLIF